MNTGDLSLEEFDPSATGHLIGAREGVPIPIGESLVAYSPLCRVLATKCDGDAGYDGHAEYRVYMVRRRMTVPLDHYHKEAEELWLCDLVLRWPVRPPRQSERGPSPIHSSGMTSDELPLEEYGPIEPGMDRVNVKDGVPILVTLVAHSRKPAIFATKVAGQPTSDSQGRRSSYELAEYRVHLARRRMTPPTDHHVKEADEIWVCDLPLKWPVKPPIYRGRAELNR